MCKCTLYKYDNLYSMFRKLSRALIGGSGEVSCGHCLKQTEGDSRRFFSKLVLLPGPVTFEPDFLPECRDSVLRMMVSLAGLYSILTTHCRTKAHALQVPLQIATACRSGICMDSNCSHENNQRLGKTAVHRKLQACSFAPGKISAFTTWTNFKTLLNLELKA